MLNITEVHIWSRVSHFYIIVSIHLYLINANGYLNLILHPGVHIYEQFVPFTIVYLF